jgi:hypothetical protein
MPAGFQTFDASGNVVVDITTGLVKFLGAFWIGASHTGSNFSGTVTDSNLTLAGHTAFALVMFGSSWAINNNPTLSISGTTITWQFPALSTRPNTRIIYGVFI